MVGVIGIIGAVSAQWLATRRDDKRWEREIAREDLRWQRDQERAKETRKIETYATFLASVQEYMAYIPGTRPLQAADIEQRQLTKEEVDKKHLDFEQLCFEEWRRCQKHLAAVKVVGETDVVDLATRLVGDCLVATNFVKLGKTEESQQKWFWSAYGQVIATHASLEKLIREKLGLEAVGKLRPSYSSLPSEDPTDVVVDPTAFGHNRRHVENPASSSGAIPTPPSATAS